MLVTKRYFIFMWCRIMYVLIEALSHPDPATAKRAFEAMMTMGKIDVAAIQAAIRR